MLERLAFIFARRTSRAIRRRKAKAQIGDERKSRRGARTCGNWLGGSRRALIEWTVVAVGGGDGGGKR